MVPDIPEAGDADIARAFSVTRQLPRVCRYRDTARRRHTAVQTLALLHLTLPVPAYVGVNDPAREYVPGIPSSLICNTLI